MEPSKIEIVCDCGKTYQLRPRAVDGEIICANCDRRILFPASLDPSLVETERPTSTKKWSLDPKSLITGLAMTAMGVAGAVVFFDRLNSGVVGRGMVLLPVVSLVFIIMGLIF